MRIPIKILSVPFVLLSLFLTSCNDDIEEPSEYKGRSTEDFQYPHVYDIVNNLRVDNEMCRAWDRMLSYVNDNSRLEIGFYIYYDKGDYWFSEWFYGPNTSYESEISPIIKRVFNNKC